MTSSGLTAQAVLAQIDTAYNKRPTNNAMAEAEAVISPAISAYSLEGTMNADVGAFNAALLYAIHKYYPMANPSGDKSKPRYYLDDLYRRTADDTTLYNLQSDVTSWITANKGTAVTGTVPAVSNLMPGTTDSLIGPSSALNPLSGIDLVGQVLSQFYDIIRWLTSPANWWRIAKFILGMGMLYYGITSLVRGTDTFKQVENIAGKAALAA